MNAVLKYPGAKWALARWVLSHFPAHHSYLEPFFGSGAVLFNKPRSHIETVNDLDGDVVNFFRWIRDDPERLAQEIYWTELPDVILQAAERLRGVQIEQRPAAGLIWRFNFPNVLIYCDPPYLRATRHMKRQYRHEMTDEDHLELLTALRDHRGPALISGYPSELYDRELAGWSKAETTAVDQTSRIHREVLWMNFDPDRQVRWF